MVKWEIREYRSVNEPHPYLLILMHDEGGFERYGHERYGDRKTAIMRAKDLASHGIRVGVVKDVASSRAV